MSINIYDVIHYPTPEEIKENILQSKRQRELGIYFTFDGYFIEDEAPSNYESIFEYENDKDLALDYIMENKDVPEELFNKLIVARKELEQRGVLKPFKESEYD